MKLFCPYFSTLIEVSEGDPFSLVIENQSLFRRFLEDLHIQATGGEGVSVLSFNNAPVPIHKYVDVIENFAPFEINTKTLLSKISTAVEKAAVDEKHYLETSQMLANIEMYLSELCFGLPLRVECRKLSAGAIIKSASLAIAEDFEQPTEAILSYMSTLLDFDKTKLFITVNIRSYFDDSTMLEFTQEIRKKQLCVLMLESTAHSMLPGTKRLVIDRDLCEF